MHLRPVFAEQDLGRIAALVAENPFGLLVTQGPEGMEASHLPFAVRHEGEGLVLAGHVAAGNRQAALFERGTALAIFSGPHAYVSPGWYRTQPAVPTWDYAAVHVHGVLERADAPDETTAMLRELAKNDPAGFDLDSLTAEYRAQMFKGIRSFRLRSTRIEAQWKMSQNRSAEDRRSVIAALRAQGNDACADLIAVTLPPA